MKKLNNSGFGIIEVLLALILLAIVSFAGYYVYSHQKDQDKDPADSTLEAGLDPITPDVEDNADAESTEEALIMAAVKQKNPDLSPEATIDVEKIEGDNAKGGITDGHGGSSFIAHFNKTETKGHWEVIFSGQEKPGKELGEKYGLPTDWYSIDY